MCRNDAEIKRAKLIDILSKLVRGFSDLDSALFFSYFFFFLEREAIRKTDKTYANVLSIENDMAL